MLVVVQDPKLLVDHDATVPAPVEFSLLSVLAQHSLTYAKDTRRFGRAQRVSPQNLCFRKRWYLVPDNFLRLN